MYTFSKFSNSIQIYWQIKNIVSNIVKIINKNMIEKIIIMNFYIYIYIYLYRMLIINNFESLVLETNTKFGI